MLKHACSGRGGASALKGDSFTFIFSERWKLPIYEKKSGVHCTVTQWSHLHFPDSGHVNVITSLAKKVMFSVVLVCLSVCLFVCEQYDSNSYEQIAMKFYGGVWGGKLNKWLNFGGDLSKWVKKNEYSCSMAWCAGNDPEFLGLAFHHTCTALQIINFWPR